MQDFLQNYIGNSSTSTTCNPIYSEGTILELKITMEFHRHLIHQHHLQSHSHCRNDPTAANHNGILSTAHARKTQVTTCELLCLLAALCDLGDPGWDPCFRMVLLLLRSPPGMALCFFGLSLLFLLPYPVKMIQCYHSCVNSTMNWYLSHFWLAVLFWVAVVCFGCVFFVLFFLFVCFVCFWFLLLFLFVLVTS